VGVVLPHQVVRLWPEVMRQPVYRVGHVVGTDVRRPYTSRSLSSDPPTQRLMRQQSGQPPSTPIQVKQCSPMSRWLSRARHH